MCRLLFPFKVIFGALLFESVGGVSVNTGAVSNFFFTHSARDKNSPSSSAGGCGSTTRPVSSAFRMENICKETTITRVS